MFTPLASIAWDLLPAALADKDIEQYIQAYNNISVVSSEIETEKKKSNSFTIITCKKCRALVADAVVGAGYKDFKAFLIMDARIHLALRYYAYLKLSELVGQTTSGIKPEEFCRNPENIKNIEKTDRKKEIKKQCQNIIMWGIYMQKIGDFVLKWVEKLLQKEDISTVGKNFDSINTALTNENLIDEYRHVRGNEFDD